MNLTKLALKRPVSCFLVILALAVFGISSIFGFKMELTPDIEMPMLIVMATYPGADPESVDELVASEGISYMVSIITDSIMERKPLAPVLRSSALSAIASMASCSKLNSTLSIWNSFWYCFTRAFFGS